MMNKDKASNEFVINLARRIPLELREKAVTTKKLQIKIVYEYV